MCFSVESQPVCGTFPNKSNDGISLDEIGNLQLTCTMKFNGNLRASMEWRLGNGLSLPGYIETTETTSNLTGRNGTSVSSSITISNFTTDFTHDVRFNCTVYFLGTSREDPPKHSEKYVVYSWISPSILGWCRQTYPFKIMLLSQITNEHDMIKTGTE